jgi:mycoredoxin
MAQHHIRLYTRSWCEDSQAAKEFLAKRQILFQEIDIEENPEAAEFVKSVNEGKERTPTVEVDGRVFHASPFNAEKFACDLGIEP